MNKMENELIQSMIQGQRSRCESRWPGRAMKEPAVTQYPNILVEIEASGTYLRRPAEHAGAVYGRPRRQQGQSTKAGAVGFDGTG